jgi:hypothetical protein
MHCVFLTTATIITAGMPAAAAAAATTIPTIEVQEGKV